MTATLMMEDYRVTSDKLEEWKDVIPRAGPKYRLGMYFDTIHEIPEFDAVINPDGYQSHWETDTDLQTDDEYGDFIFSQLEGDSASVICLEDEADTTELVERFKLGHRTPVANVSPLVNSTQAVETMYENIDGEDEHVYESIEDCAEEYQLYIGSEDCSPPHNTAPATTQAKITKKVKPYNARRSNSLPFSSSIQPEPSLKLNVRKYSDCTEYAKLSRRHQRSSSLDKNTLNSILPPPLPPPNNSSSCNEPGYTSLFRVTAAAPAPTSKSPEIKKQSPTHTQQQQQVVLKHKGRQYLLPLTDNKPRRHSASSSSPKHASIHTSLSTNSHLNNCYSTVAAAQQRQQRASPPRQQQQDNKDTLAKKKAKHSSIYSTIPSNTTCPPSSTVKPSPHVTLYGVL